VNATLNQQHSLDFIQNMLVQETAQKGIAMGIFLNEKLIGSIGMHDWNHHLQKAQVGYWLIKDAEGKGLMKRTAVAFISFLFEHLGLNKVEIQFLPYNIRSSELTKKLNAKVEGILRDNIKINGAFEDVVITGILCKEWNTSINS
jgi:ribosomal-protein-serine acetyltransferase